MRNHRSLKPAVPNYVLLLLAATAWIGVGLMLLLLAFLWLAAFSASKAFLLAIPGMLAALLVHHFGFLRIVDRNLQRILFVSDKKCLFAFIPWKSYLVIAVMVILGTVLRHSAIPKSYLAILYICIGSALILSSVRYLRVFYKEIVK
jgi:hypothetical protein